jgi:hypothetical protein
MCMCVCLSSTSDGLETQVHDAIGSTVSASAAAASTATEQAGLSFAEELVIAGEFFHALEWEILWWHAPIYIATSAVLSHFGWDVYAQQAQVGGLQPCGPSPCGNASGQPGAQVPTSVQAQSQVLLCRTHAGVRQGGLRYVA